MKAIKKVAVTPVTVNDGTIINSFSTSDDKTKNAPSINAVENYAQPKVLHGTELPGSNMGNDGDIYLQHA